MLHIDNYFNLDTYIKHVENTVWKSCFVWKTIYNNFFISCPGPKDHVIVYCYLLLVSTRGGFCKSASLKIQAKLKEKKTIKVNKN